ncbi:hypothetical protein SAMN04490220_9051 [Rhodococcus jostii]|uniref:VOC domain-containing protein n=1 Tax=Rhodococcus jostii TaxID=132919 RepID=A0A1H5MJA1_RHOJO|nr:hypothetical protein SAMN04490220_9051 [Rhodococcus jostii]
MSTTEIRAGEAVTTTATVDTKFEVLVLPVTDVDRATDFYTSLGWRQDDAPPGSGVVEFTPTGAGTSVHFGAHLTTAAPGSAKRSSSSPTSPLPTTNWSPRASPSATSSTTPPTARPRSRPRPRQLQLVRHFRRPRRQHLGPPGSHHPPPRPHHHRSNNIQFSPRPDECASSRRNRSRRAREAHRYRGSELARLVRRLHDRRTG